MLKILRSRQPKNAIGAVLLKLAILPIVGGGVLSGWGFWLLTSGRPVADTFGAGLLMSIALFLGGIGTFVYGWRLPPENTDNGEAK